MKTKDSTILVLGLLFNVIVIATVIALVMVSSCRYAHASVRMEPYRCRVTMKGYHIFARTRATSAQQAAWRVQERYPKGRVNWCLKKD